MITVQNFKFKFTEALKTTVTRIASSSSCWSYPVCKCAFTDKPIYCMELISGLHADNEWCYLLKGGHCGAARERERRWLEGRQMCVRVCVFSTVALS